MQALNVIWVFSPEGDRVLMCRRRKPPYMGLLCLVGGKIETGEDGMTAALRELREETNITGVSLTHVMDLTYYTADESRHFNADESRVEVYAGRMSRPEDVFGDENELAWVDVGENFFDMTRFSGAGNLGHIYEMIKQIKPYIFRGRG